MKGLGSDCELCYQYKKHGTPFFKGYISKNNAFRIGFGDLLKAFFAVLPMMLHHFNGVAFFYLLLLYE
jgi:hypothetical protein